MKKILCPAAAVAAALFMTATAVFSGCRNIEKINVTLDSLSTADKVDIALLDELIENGKFRDANRILNGIEKLGGLTPQDRYEIAFERDKMNRMLKEFSKTDEEVLPYIKKYMPEVTEAQLDEWRASGALECKVIDGKRLYFSKGPRNLFRLVPECVEAYEKVEGKATGTTGEYLATYLPSVIEAAVKKQQNDNAETPQQTIHNNSFVMPQTFTVHVLMRVMPDAVPAGEVVRMWLPYPRVRDKQQNIKLERVFTGYNSVYESHPTPLAGQDGDFTKAASVITDGTLRTGFTEDVQSTEPFLGNGYIISAGNATRRSIYFEMVSNGKDTLKAGYDLTFTSYNQYFANLESEIKPYDTESELYKRYTSERERHIVFTPRIKELAESIVGDETRPYEKVKKIWCWINDHITWAGARDYSTIPDIPTYVLKNSHGDCGEFSLLFITMARYVGIPAKWQSGWMLHPGNVNLHDWAEVYYEGVGWVPVDQSFGYSGGDRDSSEGIGESPLKYFFSRGLDAYRYIVNDDYGAWAPLYPAKIYPHNDEVDFQMGEVEWRCGNVLNGDWRCWMNVEYK